MKLSMTRCSTFVAVALAWAGSATAQGRAIVYDAESRRLSQVEPVEFYDTNDGLSFWVTNVPCGLQLRFSYDRTEIPDAIAQIRGIEEAAGLVGIPGVTPPTLLGPDEIAAMDAERSVADLQIELMTVQGATELRQSLESSWQTLLTGLDRFEREAADIGSDIDQLMPEVNGFRRRSRRALTAIAHAEALVRDARDPATALPCLATASGVSFGGLIEQTNDLIRRANHVRREMPGSASPPATRHSSARVERWRTRTCVSTACSAVR